MTRDRQLIVARRCTDGRALVLILAGLLLGSAQAATPAYQVTNFAIEEPLTSTPGDAQRGQQVLVARDLGNCLSCHAVPIDAEFFGDVGPSLAGVGSRLSAGQLRLRVVDPKRLNPQTVMPAYFRSEGLNRVLPEYQGKTILTAQQVEDLVAFLLTLKSSR